MTLLALHSPFEPASGPPTSVPDIVQDVRLVRYAMLAGLVLQMFDYIIVFDEEVRLVWLRHSPGNRRIVFLINRYYPFITAISACYFSLINPNHGACHIAHFVVAGIALLGAVIAEVTLFIRTCVIYGRNSKVSLLLYFLALFSTAGSSVNTAFYIAKSSVLDVSFPYKGCIYWYRLKIEWLSIVLLIICESVAFCLLVRKIIWNRRHAESQLLRHICRDSLYYFVCIIGSSIVNLVIQLFASNLLCDALLIPQSILHQILCTHFILRMRRLSEEAPPLALDNLSLPLTPLPLKGSTSESERSESDV
ncbi:uncharacterized protein FOMMEDRAFT_168898 [Fomitiporia mediterranea MF3/22]|uniref:uncharacterized protein n=1 Tax=Fomitiporia mediterranea (strain MF3/22) TaxID=694068 RepID=UPI000440901C|nr:uncharacterized protein FOMMEDRAFT_168898 [Fomitiporia mediterranea MF3/22]EJD02437.1 hypothetical protein FOMMEDRAFT_168898 [Fomitiporia mediterranea MF3/22]